MSPIKFEENIKTELEKRTIPITEGSWEKLQSRLEPEPKNKNSKLFWIIGLAASLVVAFWLSKDFYTGVPIEPNVVENPKEETIPLEVETEKVLQPQKEEVLVAQDVEELPNKEIEIAVVPKRYKPIEEQPELHKDEVVATTVEEIKPTKELSFEDKKVQEVVAQIVELKKSNTAVTDDEIDALLRTAQREIEVKQLLIENASFQNAGTVNPDVLLYQVEMELDKSFRTKVFEELKIQFNSVKNAVAQRND